MAAIVAYITVGSKEEAEVIARTLVAERLAACANVIAGAQSVYRWQGQVEQAEESVVIAKTRDDLLHSLTDRVRALHSYECPCVVGLPVAGGNPDYLDWIASETLEPSG